MLRKEGKTLKRTEKEFKGMGSNFANKKILIFHSTIAPYRISFFNELYKRFEARVCLYYKNLKSQKFDYDAISQKFQFKPDYFKKSITIKGRSFYFGHKKRILEYNPDVVIVGEYGEGLWSAILTRYIYRKHYKIITICDDSFNMAKECKGVRKVSRNIGIKYLDGIILCNEKVERWYKENFKAKTFVFPIIQDEREFYENRDQIVNEAHKLIKSYNLVGKRIFLYVGRMAPEKNVEYLVKSFLESHKSSPDNVLVLIGGMSKEFPDILSRIQSMIKDANGEEYIYYVGRKEGIELMAWYFAGQILVLPSICEAFGAVVNEALLAGEYAMVSDNAGAVCLINEENGMILDITKPMIDFKEIALRIKPIKEPWEPHKSRMPFLFQDKMILLDEWIRNA